MYKESLADTNALRLFRHPCCVCVFFCPNMCSVKNYCMLVVVVVCSYTKFLGNFANRAFVV